MLRNKRYIRNSVRFSIFLHTIVFGLCFLPPLFKSSRPKMLFVDVELNSLEQPGESSNKLDTKIPNAEEKSVEKDIEPLEIEKPKIPEIKQQSLVSESEKNIEELEQPNTKEKAEEPKTPGKTTIDEDSEPIPIKKDKPKKEAKPKKKTKKKRNRKALLNVLNRVDNQEKNKRANEAFSKMLQSTSSDLKGKTNQAGNRNGIGTGKSGNASEIIDIISSQIYPHWVVPGGVKDAENIIVEIRVKLKENGSVVFSDLEVIDKARYAKDHIFRAVADSAKRAILSASPLKISKEQIDMYRDFILRFNLKEALGG